MLLACTYMYAQQGLPAKKINANSSKSNSSTLSPKMATSDIPQPDKSVMVTTCTDKVDYAGTATGYYSILGGVMGDDAECQSFPGYTGQVTKVDFTAAKYSTDYTVQVSIHALDASFLPTGPALSATNILVNTTTASNYSATIASPVNVTNGFAVIIWKLATTDSVKIYTSPDATGGGNDFANAYTAASGFTSFLTAYGLDLNQLMRPTIKFNMPTPTSLSATPSPVCANVTVNFFGTNGTAPMHFNDPIFNPSGVNDVTVYGDATPNGSGSSTTHAYTTSGTKNASYTQNYVGWNSTCPSSPANATVIVNAATTSLFSYSNTDLNLTVNNLSTNATTYSWNFGDLTSSTLANPPMHTYASPGTYIVELDVTGPCGGTVIYSQSITVAVGTSGGNASVTEVSNIGSVGIYPNPANSTVTINYNIVNNNDNTTLQIVNTLGQIVKTENIGGSTIGILSIDISDISAGTYYVKLSNDKGNVVRPLIKK